jgi:ribosome biogenesis protein Nip4
MKELIKQFTKQEIIDGKVQQRGNEFFVLPDAVSQVVRKAKLPWRYAGKYLGMQSQKSARPSLDLLQMLAGTDAKQAVLNGKGAWLFVCKRPALKASILHCNAKPGELVLVLNENNECLGYGLFTGNEIRNYYDIGDFLRRERRARRA